MSSEITEQNPSTPKAKFWHKKLQFSVIKFFIILLVFGVICAEAAWWTAWQTAKDIYGPISLDTNTKQFSIWGSPFGVDAYSSRADNSQKNAIFLDDHRGGVGRIKWETDNNNPVRNDHEKWELTWKGNVITSNGIATRVVLASKTKDCSTSYIDLDGDGIFDAIPLAPEK